MPGNQKYIRYTWVVLIMVFLVILAGGVVRMTQSGMGCPDWPKCFGRWIPPTSADQLPPDFEKYLSKQDIDHSFNVYHTWIEYINRLLGALLGVFIFIHFIWSYTKFRKSQRSIVVLSLLLLLAVGFQGWLGKRVVDTNLTAVKITTHMLVALVIAALPLLIIYRVRQQGRVTDRVLKNLINIELLLLLIQIALGTQVREQIDEISRSLQYEQRELWIGRLDDWFIIHRSLSWAIGLGSLWLYWKARPYSALKRHSLLLVALVLATVIAGIIMAWWNVPALAQPLHLLLASILIITIFGFRLKLK
jgi:cytochrome c oxidase assembly protein subunit 15